METHRYLLDTNILSHMIRNPSGPVFDRLKSIVPATACTSINDRTTRGTGHP